MTSVHGGEGPRSAVVYSGALGHKTTWVEYHWRKMRNESDQIFARPHAAQSSAAAILLCHHYCISAVLYGGPFPNSTGALQSGPLEVEEEHSVARCDLFANYFAGKIDHICSELNDGLIAQSLDVLECRIFSYCMGSHSDYAAQ